MLPPIYHFLLGDKEFTLRAIAHETFLKGKNGHYECTMEEYPEVCMMENAFGIITQSPSLHHTI